MRKKDLIAFGYREIEHAGFSWLANEEGVKFLSSVDDWSPGVLTVERGWHCRTKRDHAVYVALDRDGIRFLIKDYPLGDKCKVFLGGKANRATREFFKTLVAYKKDIQTVLPLAVGKWKEGRERGLIIYPFLDKRPLWNGYTIVRMRQGSLSGKSNSFRKLWANSCGRCTMRVRFLSMPTWITFS